MRLAGWYGLNSTVVRRVFWRSGAPYCTGKRGWSVKQGGGRVAAVLAGVSIQLVNELSDDERLIAAGRHPRSGEAPWMATSATLRGRPDAFPRLLAHGGVNLIGLRRRSARLMFAGNVPNTTNHGVVADAPSWERRILGKMSYQSHTRPPPRRFADLVY